MRSIVLPIPLCERNEVTPDDKEYQPPRSSALKSGDLNIHLTMANQSKG